METSSQSEIKRPELGNPGERIVYKNYFYKHLLAGSVEMCEVITIRPERQVYVLLARAPMEQLQVGGTDNPLAWFKFDLPEALNLSAYWPEILRNNEFARKVEEGREANMRTLKEYYKWEV